MDKSIVSPESGREKWISFERAAEIVLLDMPATYTLLDAKTRVVRLAEDKTLRCRDSHTGDIGVQFAPVGRDGRHLGKLVPEVEIELRSFQHYLLRLCTQGKTALTVDDIRKLGDGDVDLVEVLERRLTTSEAPVENEVSTAQAATERPRGGSPGKRFKVEMAFHVGYGITELKSPDVASVKELILGIAAAREGWDLHPDTAHGWAQEFIVFYNQRNRET